MAFFRQYIAPLLVVLIFALSLVAVSARIFLPNDLAAPAPIEEMQPASRPAMPSVSQSITSPSSLI